MTVRFSQYLKPTIVGNKHRQGGQYERRIIMQNRITILRFCLFFQGKSKETYDAGKTVLEYGRRHSNIRSQDVGY